MDQNEEYHDPDYPEIPVVVKKEVLELSEDEKIEKIRSIIRREFSNELEIRENEVMLIEQRMSTSRRLLQRLRYALVSGYYRDQKLQLSASHIDDDVAQMEPRARVEVSSILREGQRRLHPSVRKLLGKQTVDLEEIFMSRPLRNKTRKNYSAMVQTRNYTIPADTTKSLRPEPKLELEESNPEPGCSKPRKTPRHLEPRQQKVITFDDPTRNQTKHRYRLIIGNTSKYAPGASSADRSTHKWLLYVRGPAEHAAPGPVLTHLVARLHHSYAPHHTVRLTKPPFHISRRGWGEFPARLELHFPLPARNRPACLEHTIKLDRNYTGLQTLGAETIVDVWLYSTPEMLEYEYFDPIPAAIEPADPPTEPTTDIPTEETEIQPKIEPIEYDTTEQTDDWMEFFSKDTTELDVDEMIIKPVKKEIVEEEKVTSDVENMINANVINKDEETIKTESDWCVTELEDIPQVPEVIVNQPSSPKKRIMKYIDSATRKIYYLEMDRTLDLSKVQEIVINNSKVAKISPVKTNGLKNVRKRKGGVSLLKPEVKNQLKSDNFKDKPLVKKNFTHIENDHCYLGNNWLWKPIDSTVLQDDSFNVASEVKEKSLYDSLCSAMCSFTCVRGAVNYMLKKIPVITECARDVDFVRKFPFVVENEERYWKLDFAKRRNIEWSRAKLINRLLTEYFTHTEQIWRTKQILIYSRLHGYNPIRPDPVKIQPESDEWSSWNDMDCTRKSESNIKAVFPNASDICSLTVFNSEDYLNCTQTDSIENLDSDEEEVDIMCSDSPVKVRHNVSLDCSGSELTVLPVQDEDDRLRFMFIERKCADIGVELRNEDVGNGCSYSAVHAVLLSAVKCFAEELIRGALAEKLTEDVPEDTLPPVWIGSSRSVCVGAAAAWRAAAGRLRPALGTLGTRGTRGTRGARPGATHEKL